MRSRQELSAHHLHQKSILKRSCFKMLVPTSLSKVAASHACLQQHWFGCVVVSIVPNFCNPFGCFPVPHTAHQKSEGPSYQVSVILNLYKACEISNERLDDRMLIQNNQEGLDYSKPYAQTDHHQQSESPQKKNKCYRVSWKDAMTNIAGQEAPIFTVSQGE